MQSLALRTLRKRKPQETQALAFASSQSWLPLLRPIGMLGRSSGNHDWLLTNASACVSCGFRLRNACNTSDCVWMETRLHSITASVINVNASCYCRALEQRSWNKLSRVYTRATCCPDEQLVSGYYVDGHMLPGNKLLVRDTCWLYLGDIITILLCHGRLVSLCNAWYPATDGQQSDDTRNMLTATCWPGVNAALVTTLPIVVCMRALWRIQGRGSRGDRPPP